MNHSTPGLPVHHQPPGFTQTHVHWVSDASQPTHPLLSPPPPALSPCQHQSLFQWVNAGVQPQQSPGIPSGWTTLANEWMNNRGWPSFSERGPSLYFQSGLLYPELYIEQSEKRRVDSTFHQYYLLSIPGSFLQVLFFVHYLLARRPVDILWPFLIKVGQLKQLFSLEMFFLKFLSLRHP